MNKTAFSMLIEQLTKNFTVDKIRAYKGNLNEFKSRPVNVDESGNDKELNAFADIYWTSNHLKLLKSKELRENTKDYNYLKEAKKKEIDIAIAGLDMIGEIAEQLKGKSLDIGIKILRNHFKTLYQEAYLYRLGTSEEKEEAIRDNPILYYFLLDEAMGGPEFDDLVIYNFMSNLCSHITNYARFGNNKELLTNLITCQNLMEAADMGLDHTHDFFPVYYAGKDDELEQDINKKGELFDHVLFMNCVKKVNPIMPFNVQELAGKDGSYTEEEICDRFFSRKMYKNLSKTPDMIELIQNLNDYLLVFNTPEEKDKLNTVEFFKNIQQMAGSIRKNTNAEPKAFHATEMYLQDVEAFSEKMIGLRDAAENPEKASERMIGRMRDKADQLFERLEHLSYGKQSKEFALMKKAMEKLSSKTACDSRELLEQMLEAKSAADAYIKGKDSIRMEGKRSTEKGQARYDAAKSISSMLAALITPLSASLKNENIRFVKNYNLDILKKKENQVDKDFPDFCFSKEYYLHCAQSRLQNMQEMYERYYATSEKDFPEDDYKQMIGGRKKDYKGYLSEYAFYMDLAMNKQKRERMTLYDLESVGQKPAQLTFDSSKELWKYFIIIVTKGEANPVKEDGSIDTKIDFGILLKSEWLEELYQTVLKQKEILNKIAQASGENVEKALHNSKAMKSAADNLAKSLCLDHYPDEVEKKLAATFYKERVHALLQRREELTANRQNQMDGNNVPKKKEDQMLIRK